MYERVYGFGCKKNIFTPVTRGVKGYGPFIKILYYGDIFQQKIGFTRVYLFVRSVCKRTPHIPIKNGFLKQFYVIRKA